jgi:hypothetical protein
MRLVALLVLALALPLAGARADAVRAPAVAPPAAAADARAPRAAALLRAFQSRLQAALQEGLARGPEAAIDACRARAPAIAAELSPPGVEMGRTSHKLRNPANAPRPWVAPLLARAVADPASARPERVELGGGRIGYVEPIRLQPTCLLCHGEMLAPPLAARIRALYPQDQATGFRVGDLRGLFWVELPTE